MLGRYPTPHPMLLSISLCSGLSIVFSLALDPPHNVSGLLLSPLSLSPFHLLITRLLLHPVQTSVSSPTQPPCLPAPTYILQIIVP